MKFKIILLFLAIISCFACEKEATSNCPKNLEEGRIIGYDFRKCGCCSGYWIEVGNDTLRTFVLPDNIEIADTNLVEGLDIPICFSYEKAKSCNDFDELVDVKEMIIQ